MEENVHRVARAITAGSVDDYSFLLLFLLRSAAPNTLQL